jgi:hypothetical protein
MGNARTGKREALSAALRRFPRFELTIRRLIDADETFCDICEELAEAELALATVDGLQPGLREARRAEWQELVDRLAGEAKAVIEDRNPALRRGGALPQRPR